MSSAKFLICFLLAVVTAGIYWPVHRAEFVNYDKDFHKRVDARVE